LLRHGVGILRVDPLERRTSRPGRYSDRSVLPCGPRVSFAKTPAPPARTRRTVSEAQEASRRPSSGAPPHDEHQHAALLRPRGVRRPASEFREAPCPPPPHSPYRVRGTRSLPPSLLRSTTPR